MRYWKQLIFGGLLEVVLHMSYVFEHLDLVAVRKKAAQNEGGKDFLLLQETSKYDRVVFEK